MQPTSHVFGNTASVSNTVRIVFVLGNYYPFDSHDTMQLVWDGCAAFFSVRVGGELENKPDPTYDDIRMFLLSSR